jgi:hypothetical protein
MPFLDLVNKAQAVSVAGSVPYHLLNFESAYGDPSADNMLIQGDDLLALKALLPFYRGHPSATSRPPRLRQTTTGISPSRSPSRPDLNQLASTKPGPVQSLTCRQSTHAGNSTLISRITLPNPGPLCQSRPLQDRHPGLCRCTQAAAYGGDKRRPPVLQVALRQARHTVFRLQL